MSRTAQPRESALSWSDALALYELHLRAARKSPLTIKGYRQVLEALVRRLSTQGVDTPAAATLQALRSYTCGLMTGETSESGRPLKPSVVARVAGTIASLFAFLHAEGRLQTNPTLRLERPRVPDQLTQAHPPPLVSGKRIKIRYMTQIKTRPPTFALFAQKGEELPDAYHRYLMNGIRESFGLEGVPLRLYLRKGENPFDKKD